MLTFGDFELDIDGFELRRQGKLRRVEPRVFDLIAHFASNPGKVFSHDDLIACVWRGRVVSDTTVSTCIKNARKALGDSGENQRYIVTVRGRGFRFAAKVETGGDGRKVERKTAGANKSATFGTRPSLLIVPFRSLSDHRNAVELADGVSSDLGTILTRIPLLRISSKGARYLDRDLAPSAREIHETLGVDFVLEGTLHARDGGVRINVQLSDARSGFQLWAEQFSLPCAADAAHDRAVTAVIAKLEPQLHRAIYDSVRASDGEPNAQQLFLEASSILALKGWHPASFTAAAKQLRRSCELDPDFALAFAYLALVVGLGTRVGLTGDQEKTRVETLEAAERALELDAMDSTVLGFAGCALADIGYPSRALPILRNAVEINPSNAQAWAALGSVCLILKRVDEAVRHLTHGINISPLDSRLSMWGALLALALMFSKDLDGALQQAELARQRDYRNFIPPVALAGIQLLRGEPSSAFEALSEARRLRPNLGPAQVYPLLGEALGANLLSLN